MTQVIITNKLNKNDNRSIVTLFKYQCSIVSAFNLLFYFLKIANINIFSFKRNEEAKIPLLGYIYNLELFI
jgi:hypothetical protein